MEITINYNFKKYNESDIRTRLLNIILKNLKVLKVISNIYIHESGKGKLDSTILERIIKQSVRAGYININEANEFKNLWIKIDDEKIGDVLEQLIANLGPYESLNDFDKSMEVKVFETKMDNNFDVVFFDKSFSCNCKTGNNIKIQGDNEFHECKKNVCTYIPININSSLKDKVKRKLEFIKCTYDLQEKGRFYIPTFFPEVEQQREFLKEYKAGIYKFIDILSIEDIYSRYSRI